MKYFNKKYHTLEQLRKHKKELFFSNHPDRGGDEETFKEIANEFEELKKNDNFLNTVKKPVEENFNKKDSKGNYNSEYDNDRFYNDYKDRKIKKEEKPKKKEHIKEIKEKINGDYMPIVTSVILLVLFYIFNSMIILIIGYLVIIGASMYYFWNKLFVLFTITLPIIYIFSQLT